MRPRYFRSKSEFRAWLAKHHEDKEEVFVGYHKVKTGKPSMTWSGSVDEALCFGWIDGIRRTVDEERYCIRFTPRRAQSNWSAVNIRKVEALKKAGKMKPAGLAAFALRNKGRSRIYGYEKKAVELREDLLGSANDGRFAVN